MATLGFRRCFEFVARGVFDADGETVLSNSEVLKDWLETPPPEAPFTTAGGAGDVDRERAVTLDAQQEDLVFFKSYIPRTLNDVYDPERDLEAVKKGGKTIYSDTIGVVKPKSEATTLQPDEKETIEREKPKVRFSTGVELEDETHGADASDDEEGEDEDEDSQDEEGGEDGEPREKKPRGHRHEDKEAKKVGEAIGTTLA